MIIDAHCHLGEGFRFSQSAEALLLEMDKNNVEKAVVNLENVSRHGALDYAMLTDFAKAINGEPCKIDLKQGLRTTLPGLFALESSR